MSASPSDIRSPRMEALARLPVFFALAGKRAVVAGGSAAAAWKIELLSAAGAHVEPLKPFLTQDMLDGLDRFWRARALSDIGFGRALPINDFVALAYAVDVLGDSDACPIGPNIAGLPGEPISILGAGTGFGVSCLVRSGDRVVPIATEGGHIGFAPGNDEELGVWRCLWKEFGRVSIERVLSGPGLENIYRALQQVAGRQSRTRSAAQITADAIGGDADCLDALNLFCAIFGSVAGDFALAHGARGGVYIAGGIAQKILAFLVHSEFRKRFESKGRLSPFVEAIPTNLILNADAALLGCARAGLAGQRIDH